MGRKIKLPQGDPPKFPPGDVTKPWKRQFFETKSIGPEPPLNIEGFWKKPKHGLKGIKHDRSNDTRK